MFSPSRITNLVSNLDESHNPRHFYNRLHAPCVGYKRGLATDHRAPYHAVRRSSWLPGSAPVCPLYRGTANRLQQPKPPQPLSALAVLRGVRAEHVARGITPPPLTLAAKRAHELMLKYVRDIGHENVVPERVIPMNHQLITALLAILFAACGRP